MVCNTKHLQQQEKTNHLKVFYQVNLLANGLELENERFFFFSMICSRWQSR